MKFDRAPQKLNLWSTCARKFGRTATIQNAGQEPGGRLEAWPHKTIAPMPLVFFSVYPRSFVANLVFSLFQHSARGMAGAYRFVALALAAYTALAQSGQIASARKALDYLLNGKYDALSRMAAPNAASSFTPQFLRERPGAEITKFGRLQQVGAPVTESEEGNLLVSFPVKFEKVAVNVQFTINASGQLAGLYFRPANSPLPPLWRRPSYSRPEAFHSREVTIGDDPWKLGGTLLIPNGKGPFPALLLIHGPGPNDRDESIHANKVFADLAEGLASRGIAVLRYDKRTKAYPEKMSELNYTVQDETVDDALKALALLRRQPEIAPGRIFALGHSLGGYLLDRVASRDGKLSGLIFLAANARPVEVMALEQNEYVSALSDHPTPDSQKRLADLRAEVLKVRTLDPKAKNPPILMGLPLAYLLDLKGYDPFAVKNLGIRMLFLQGERDFQTTVKDFDLWKSAMAGRKNAEFHSYPSLNHLFMVGNGKSTPGEYQIPGNVSGEVIRDIANWVGR